MSKSRKTRDAFADALRHHQAGRIDDAVAGYKRALSVNPDYAEAHNNLGVALVAQGRIVDSMAHYERALILKPDYADAHNNLGLALAAQSRIDEAMAHYERALVLNPGHANAHNNLGVALAARGRLDDAVAHYERALVLKPDYANAHRNLGLALAAQGRFDDAVAHYERSLVLNPNHADTHNNLGNALKTQGRIGDAVAHYERALALNPGHVNAHNSLGLALTAQGRIDDAMAHYERALALKPDDADAHNNLGILLHERGRIDDAVAHYERAIALKPDDANAHSNLGNALASEGRADDAVAQYERALALNPGHANAHCNLGIALAAQGNVDGARAHYERTLAIDPDHAEAHNNLANIFKDQGRFDDAMAHYGRAIAIRPAWAEAHFNRTKIKTFRPGDDELAALEALAGRDNLSATQAMHIHFALAKALEDSEDYVRAFEHLRKGNDLKRRQIDYDEVAAGRFFQRISAVFNSRLFDRFRGEGDPSPVPIFVLGMPRSGSTLIEQILASHPQIHGAGELTDLEIAASTVLGGGDNPVPFPECVPALDGAALRRIGQCYVARLPVVADGKVRIVDKLPGNFLRIGLIRLVLPNARIIHTMRDPIDTCVSCYSKLFTSGHDFSYDLAELGRYYGRYRELMAHWRLVLPPGGMLDVSYEDVVDDLEGQARRLIDYCGLPWDDGCISFHKTRRPVKTASAVQVRQPLYRGSLQRWRKYEADLGALLHALGDDAPSGRGSVSSEVAPVRAGEEIDARALGEYLRGKLEGAGEDVVIEQFPGGHSNLTYLVRAGGKEYVLRRPPLGPVAPKAHDMAREFRVLEAVHPVFPPAPRVFLMCEDPAVIGAAFFLMERRHGVVPRLNAPPEFANDPEFPRKASEGFIDCLAQLHAIDIERHGLSGLGRTEGFLERQVRGWTERWERAKTEELAGLDGLLKWLVDRLPVSPQATLIHNDFKLDNIMLDAREPGRVEAVLDWEMATVGDPLMDLGCTLCYWTQAGDPEMRGGALSGITATPGWLTRGELVRRYAEKAGRDVASLGYYEVFGLFKLGVILQQIYFRYHRGQTHDERFRDFHLRVRGLMHAAIELAERLG